MTERLHLLSEKERQTLRLLLAGHDAKSMARQLNLSVHTINERLRDARRKLAVSSSREAARLLRAAEGEAPQMVGDNPLGGAPERAAVQPAAHSPSASDRRGRRGWVTGGIVMSISLAMAALVAVSGNAPAFNPALSFGPDAGSVTAAAPAPAPTDAAVIAAARQWLAHSDAGDAGAAWDATGPAFRALNTPAGWGTAFGRVRAPLGAMIERQLLTIDYAPAPPRGYYVVKFRTRYANRADVLETLSLAWEDGRWGVVGITVD